MVVIVKVKFLQMRNHLFGFAFRQTASFTLCNADQFKSPIACRRRKYLEKTAIGITSRRCILQEPPKDARLAGEHGKHRRRLPVAVPLRRVPAKGDEILHAFHTTTIRGEVQSGVPCLRHLVVPIAKAVEVDLAVGDVPSQDSL